MRNAFLSAVFAALQIYGDDYKGEGVHPVPRYAESLVAEDQPSQSRSALLSELEFEAIIQRMQRMADYVGTTDLKQNTSKFEKTILDLTRGEDGEKVDIETFVRRVNDTYHAVFTAHPCFNMNPELAGLVKKNFNQCAGGERPSPEVQEKLRAALAKPYQNPDLNAEASQAHEAMEGAHDADDILVKAIIDIAQQEYSDEWDQHNYMPHGIGSWVKFDWGGRTDITWNMALGEFIDLQMRMLKRYDDSLEQLHSDLKGQDKAAVTRLRAKIDATVKKLGPHKKFFDRDDLTPEMIAARVKKLDEDVKARITDPEDLVKPLQNILDRDDDLTSEAKARLVRLRSKVKKHGLVLARPYFRINSASALRALQQATGVTFNPKIEGGDRDRAYMSVAEKLLKDAVLQPENLTEIDEYEEPIEKQMIVMSQILKYFDSDGPLRFLIEETDSALVPLTALAFAKENGVEDKIDISPLIEERTGIDAAEDMVERLYKNPEYRAYIAKRGVINIQFGYSDLGRYDNQIAAGAHFERVQGKLLKLHAKYAAEYDELKDVEVGFFKTHGGSAGRGTHPGSMKQRVDYNNSPFISNYARKLGIKLRHDTSYQGSDEYGWWGSAESSAATLNHYFSGLSGDHKDAGEDPYYHSEGQKHALRFMENMRAEHSALKDEPGYAKLIAFYKNMLPVNGSRPVVRETNPGDERDLPRAIVDTGTKAQLGVQSGVTYGIGAAIKDNPEGYKYLMKESPVFRDRMAMAEAAMEESDPYLLRTYIELLNPLAWQERARAQTDPVQARACFEVSNQLSRSGLYAEFSPIVQTMTDDYETMKQTRDSLDLPGDPLKDLEHIEKRKTQKISMQAVHGLRQSAIIDLYKHTVQIDDLPVNGHGMTKEGLIDEILCFNPDALDKLDKIFPVKEDTPHGSARARRKNIDYGDLHETHIAPMKQAREDIVHASHILMHLTPTGVG